MGDLDLVNTGLLGRSVLVIAEDLELALGLAALADEAHIVGSGDLAGLTDETYDAVVVQSPQALDTLLERARSRVAVGGACYVDGRAGGSLLNGGWSPVGVVTQGDARLVKVVRAPADGGDQLNLLLRAASGPRVRLREGFESEAVWAVRQRALSPMALDAATVPTATIPSPSKPAAVSAPKATPVAGPRPSRPAAVSAPSSLVGTTARRAGLRALYPESLADSGAGFERRLALAATAALIWTLLGLGIAISTNTGWIAVALWVVFGLQLVLVLHSELTRRSLKMLILRTSTKR